MHQFTDKDIKDLKSDLWYVLLHIFIREFDFTPYIESNLITLQQCDTIVREVQSTYPGIELEPLPQSLRPLIEICKDRVAKSKVSPPRSRYSQYQNSYDWDYEYEWDNYRRQRDEYDY